MLDVGWSEMLVIAIVMIVVVGPKDLPQMLRTIGRMTTKMRGMANDFQKQFNEALKEAELDDVKKSVDSLRSLNPAAEIRKQLNPFEKAGADVRAGIDNVMKPKPATTPTPAEAIAAAVTGAKTGEAQQNNPVVPGGPESMPPAPTFPAMTDASASAQPSPGVAKKNPAKTRAASSSKAAAVKVGAAPVSTEKVKPKAPPKAPVAKVAKPTAAKAAPAKSSAPGKASTKAAKPAKKPARAPK